MHFPGRLLREFFNVKGNGNTLWLLKIRLLICHCKLKLFVFKPQLLFQLTHISDRNISFKLAVVFLYCFFTASQGMKVNFVEATVVWSHRTRLEDAWNGCFLFFFLCMFWFWMLFSALFLFGHLHIRPWKQPRIVYHSSPEKHALFSDSPSFHTLWFTLYLFSLFASPFSSPSSLLFVLLISSH